ncbi:tetratricopeptide repeat protein [Rhodovulum marinum]|uniref:Tetratricopeptide repeat protein n=1 Tax=Rhodovulum marinum TaxID=320662 RepID=A0A4R2Q4S0_9RHOB|nr:tetratricopeptide repeat protein [Rhodovulum marinum]TCP41671.1 tetratricopeptide repeat protein [Rhodovulum marinum]
MIALAACQPSGGLGPGYQGLPPPPGTPEITEAVDGLIVGHRLMAAGEYELALKAYYRAAADQGMTADVLSAVGSANLRLGRLGQAETQLRRALDQDDRFVPAWNNLGVVLMEKGEVGEARRVFETAFALDSGHSDDIRQNLLLAIAKTGDTAYAEPNKNDFELVRRGSDRYLLLATP